MPKRQREEVLDDICKRFCYENTSVLTKRKQEVHTLHTRRKKQRLFCEKTYITKLENTILNMAQNIRLLQYELDTLKASEHNYSKNNFIHSY